MLDEKFNEMAIRQFEEAKAGIHEYWVVGAKLNFTKSPLARRCNLRMLIPQLVRPDVKGVIFHSLPSAFYGLLRCIPDDKCVVWLGWGYDYYTLLNHENEESRILPKTRILQMPPIRVRAKNQLRRIVKKILLWERWRTSFHPGTLSDLARVDYFSPVLNIEYEMVLRHVHIIAKYILWNYGTVEDDLSQPGVGFSSGVNILAGNSASATNNHIELFETIRDQVDLSGRKVVTPLSYGDPYYRDRVISQGKLLLGDAFLPLTDFMPKEQYLKILQSCGFVMMNHLRQEALGNICTAMVMGAKVYLNDGNPLSGWLKSRKAVFGSINQLDMQPLSSCERENNYQIIHAHWGRDVQYRKTSHLVDVILAAKG